MIGGVGDHQIRPGQEGMCFGGINQNAWNRHFLRRIKTKQLPPWPFGSGGDPPSQVGGAETGGLNLDKLVDPGFEMNAELGLGIGEQDCRSAVHL